jgi:hypothetical protein
MVCLLALMLQVGSTAGAREPVGTGPEPSPTAISWQIDLEFSDPKRIEVQLPGQSGRQTYFYMLYTATNTSDTTQWFYPAFEIVTSDLRVVKADVGIHPLVFDAIRERHRVTHRYLVSPNQAIGELKSGADNARESVAIWPASEVDVNQFSVYVGGLSGETRVVRNPAFDPNRPETITTDGPEGERTITVNPRLFTLRKTLEIRYDLPGAPAARRTAEPHRRSVTWIMR